MSLTSEQRLIQYTLSGGSQVLAVPYKFFAAADLRVTRTVSGVDTLLVNVTDYVVAGGGLPAATGTVTLSGTAGDIITIDGSIPATQPVTLDTGGAPSYQVLTGMVDRVTILAQQLLLQVSRSLRVPNTNAAQSAPSLTERRNTLISFDNNGNLNVVPIPSGLPNDVSGQLVTTAGTTASRALSARFLAPLNVKDFGAKGDGLTDDTGAIQAAINYLQAHRTPGTGLFGSLATIYFPQGTYISGPLTFTGAQALILKGDGPSASQIGFNSASASFITVNSWVWMTVQDMAFGNGSGTAYTSQTSVMFSMNPDSGGTRFKADNCNFDNCADLFLVGGTLNGDTFQFDNCRFTRAQNAWRTANTQAVINSFRNCIFGQISTGIVNVTGTGMFHLDTCNIADCAAMYKLIPQYSVYGYNSHYTATNCKMEWQSPAPQWIDSYTSDDGLAQTPIGNAVFIGCSLGGGTGANPALPTISLSGKVNVLWLGGEYGGTVKYRRNASMETADNLGVNARTEIRFAAGCRGAPDPDSIIIDGTGGEPVFVYQGCSNMPDLETGGNIGLNFRTQHSIRFQPYLNQIAVDYSASPYRATISFNGRTVRIDSVTLFPTSATPAGTKTARIFDEGGFGFPVGTVSWSTTSFSKLGFKPVFSIDPLIVVGSMGVEFALPSNASVTGFWQIEYTVLY